MKSFAAASIEQPSLIHPSLPLPVESLPSRSPFYATICIVACLAIRLVPQAFGVTPAPDGDYIGNNTAEGADALFSLTTGFGNTAIGYDALYDNNGDYNTGVGTEALFNNTSGNQNTAIGYFALFGGKDTAGGATGGGNTATGYMALPKNRYGYSNVANGRETLYSNQDGYYNTATGASALYSNIDAIGNVADGFQALYSNTTGHDNTAVGVNALVSNQVGIYNTALGAAALYNNKGSNNIGIGLQAGQNLTTGSNNIVIGAGLLGKAAESNTTRIGKTTQGATYIGGIYGKSVSSTTTGGGVAVFVDSTGKLGTVKSSARYKEAIKPMAKASEAILQLEPVTFRYKQDLDPNGAPQFGLIAEQVEKIDPDLVVRDEDGKVSTVRYEAVNAMLLNEFLKEHRKVQSLEEKVAREETDFESKLSQHEEALRSQVDQQQKQIEALTALMGNLNAQVHLQQAAPKRVADK